MNDESKKELLKIARESVENAVDHRGCRDVFSDNPEIQGRQGVSVTLKRDGRLRGCLGHFQSKTALYKLVAMTAASSATEDPRFTLDRIYPEEVERLHIEISILSPMRKIEDPLDFRLGVDGIYIKSGGGRTGCFLPQVATETGWSKEQFLSRCCDSKDGLSSDAWKDDDVEVFVFTVEIVSE